MENRKMVPEIRFSGFTDPWEQRKLLGCIEKITDFRGRTPKKLGMDWNESGYLALSALNVKDGYIDFSQNVHYGDQALYNEWMSGNELHEGQVLFTTEAPMGNVAQVPDNKRYILSQRTIAFDVKEDVITENFLATLLRSPAVFNTLTSLSSGGTAKGVSQKSLAGVGVQVPVDLKEQTLLADYFHSLNNLITLHQRKLEKLKTFKKAMLDKMFPKNGELVPEIRFSGFTDPWEQRKLGDVGTTYTGLSGKTKEDFGHGNGKFVTYMNVFSNTVGLPDMVEPVEIDDTQNKVLYGDVLFTTSSETPEEVGMSSVWLENAENTYLNSFCFGYRPTVEFNPYYLAYMLRSFSMREKIKFLAQGISRYNISKNKMMYIEIPIPNIEEQEQIGTYFRTINNLITLHQRKLEKLQNIKKSMLNKMFI